MNGSAGQVFVVTGATGGLGEAVARRLLARGDRLLLTGRDGDRLDDLRSRLGSADTETFTGDVSVVAEAEAAAARARDRFGRVDGLVHLVGSFHAGDLAVLADPDVYIDQYRANVVSAAVATRGVLRQMDDGGYLVYISSLLALEPTPAVGPYAAAKAALLAWVKSTAREVMARGVHANAIVTTFVDTPKRRLQMPGADRSLWIPMDEVSEVIAFLTSPMAGALHGSVVPVYGRFAFQIPGGGPPAGPPGGPPASHPPGPPGSPAGAAPVGSHEPSAGRDRGGRRRATGTRGSRDAPVGSTKPVAAGEGGATAAPVEPARAGRADPQRYALLYPLRPGAGDAADDIMRAGGDPPPWAPGATRLVSTTVFRKGDTLIRLFEFDGELEEAINLVSQAAAVQGVGRQLAPLLKEGIDLRTDQGLRAFFSEHIMSVVTDRRASEGGR